MKLKNRVALVTGASRGIGRAIALTFAREGADVVVNYLRRDDKAGEVVEEIRRMGRGAMAVKADVSKRSEVDEMVKRVIGEYGGIGILVNNAGVIRRADLLSTSEEDWNIVIGINLEGVFHCTQAVAKHMVESRYGKIINISSISGLGTVGGRHIFSYAVSKGAVLTLTKTVAFELSEYGINVNCIVPGAVMTDITYEGRSKEEADRGLERERKASMLGMVSTPQDIANAALFLASDESSLITGQTIVVDGGRTDFLTHSA